jgi:hypothetical protein
MKRVCLLVSIAVALLPLDAAARQWTSRAGGFSVEAELVDVKDGNAVLKKTDGSQVSVALGTLSLGDVRYINEVLHSAEAGITGGKAESPAPVGGKTHVDSPPPEAKLTPATAATLKKLHYGWKKGQTLVYRVRIIGERGNDTENRSGDVTYKVRSTQLDEIRLAMTSKLKYETIVHHMHHEDDVLLPGRHVRFFSNADGTREAVIRIDPNGRLLESEGAAPLPYLLGDLAELIVEPLPATEQASWTITGDPGVAVVSLRYPYWRTSKAVFHEGVPAEEKTVYTVLGESGKQITIAKHYEMTSAATLAGKPRIEAAGDGRLKFDTERGVFASLDFDIQVTVRDSNKTEDTPLHISYRLLSEQDIAELAEDERKEKEEKEKKKQELTKPLTDKEIQTALDDLASDDAERIAASTKLLAEKKPQQPNTKVAKALESLMLHSENVGHRAAAAGALKNWGTEASVPSLLKALSDDWVGTRANAAEALCKYAPKNAVKPVAQLLASPHTRGSAAKCLKAIGPDAEDAVLAYIGNGDAWTRSEVCQLLGAIGTRKSLPALKKAILDDNWMVNNHAREAVKAIEARESLEPAK